VLQINEGESIKMLGSQWTPDSNNFTFKIKVDPNEDITKRKALSNLANIFDPLDWLTPITIVAKLFIQKLWLMNMACMNSMITLG
jgi:hypothetical protein